jgi:pilus assembly protein CpaB
MIRRIIISLVALLLAATGVGLMVAYAQAADERARGDVETVEVFIAVGPVPKGSALSQALDSGLLRQRLLPRALVPADVEVNLREVPGEFVALHDIRAGQFAPSASFGSAEATTAGLPVPPGMMAVTITLPDPARVAPFLRPGTQIAVFDTSEGTDDAARTTRVLLPRVTVLGVGAATSATAEGEDDAGALITLALDQKQAERLIHRVQTGSLYLALVNDASDVDPGPGVNDNNVFN